jgi:hypothetical protein
MFPSPISPSRLFCDCLSQPGAVNSPKTLSCWCCDISSSCLAGKLTAAHFGLPIVLSSLRSPECSRGGNAADWW